tara:strand:+ start:235 stop:618 length:384 start_codon:yes stop_codon:yes gene_type:complete
MMPRPKFEPTQEQERICSLGVAFGLTHEQIAKLIGCDAKTLRKHFQNALETGKEKLTMAIGSQLYKKAMNGDTISAIFLAKTKAGFQEKVEHEGIPNNISVSFNLEPEKKIVDAEIIKDKITHKKKE